jgi:hypothetical protein
MVDISGVHHETVVVVAGPTGVVAHGWIPNCTVAGFSAVQSMLTQVRLEIRRLPHTASVSTTPKNEASSSGSSRWRPIVWRKFGEGSSVVCSTSIVSPVGLRGGRA